MYDPTFLIPNLNEIMEEYIELENQTKQVSRATTGQVEDRDDEQWKNKKKRKGVDEAKVEQRKYRARNFVSDKEEALMERSLKDKGFIVEKGFKKIISHFVEMLEKRGWKSLGEHKELGCVALVKEFFTNLVEKEGKKVYVRGHWVDFSKEEINNCSV